MTRTGVAPRTKPLRQSERGSRQVARDATGDVLTVVMPVYNEGAALRATVEEVQREVLDRVSEATLLAIDDGSTDGSGALLDELARSDLRIRVLHQSNRGHGGAVLAGMQAVESEYVFLIDSDRQIPLDRFELLWAATQSGRRAAFGLRRVRRDAPTRIFLTVVIRQVLRLLFGVHVYDANIPFKLVLRADWLAAQPLVPDGTVAPSLFLGIFLKLQRLDVAEIDVVHRDRTSGQVSVRGWRMARFCARGFLQLLRFRRCYRSMARGQDRAV